MIFFKGGDIKVTIIGMCVKLIMQVAWKLFPFHSFKKKLFRAIC